MVGQTITKEEVLIAALPYITKYETKTFVIKYGGAAQVDETLRETFAKDVTLLKKIGINIIVVHGGGKEITETLSTMNIQTRFVDGQRYTDERTMEIVQMVLSGKITPEIVTRINRNGGNAVGLCGADAELITASRYSENGKDIGLVGEVTGINTSILDLLLSKGYMPVIAPTAVGSNGEFYNINADFAAAEIAAALRAEKLVYLSDVPGVIVDEKLVSSLTEVKAREMIAVGQISGGMIPKVNSAFRTINAGVNKVHLIDGRIKHSLLLEIFTDEGVGTEMLRSAS
ncbi:MAG: acetylglutamate kinase [Bacteroidota bacterium]